MQDRSQRRVANQDPALEAVAREIAEGAARHAFGDDGYCVQVIHIGGREFRCFIAPEPGVSEQRAGQTITVIVPE